MFFLIVAIIILLAAIYVGLNCVGIGLVPVIDSYLSRLNTSSLLIVLSLMSVAFVCLYQNSRIRDLEQTIDNLNTSVETQNTTLNGEIESIGQIKQTLEQIAASCKRTEDSTRELLEEAKAAMGKG